jgi:hypothetical protein
MLFLHYSLESKNEPAPVAHPCNPSYSEGKDLEEHGSKLAPGKYFSTPYLKKKKKNIT